MKRLAFLLLLVSLACGWVPLATVAPGMPTAVRTSVPDAVPGSATGTARSQPPRTPQPAPTFTPTPVPPPLPTPVPDPQLRAEDVLLLPWPLYEGDRLTVDVDPLLPGIETWPEDADAGMDVVMAVPDGETFSARISPMGLDRQPQARFAWITTLPRSSATDTGATWTITLTLMLPDYVPDADLTNNTLVIDVPLASRETLPPPEPEVSWRITETAGFVLHYLTGSAAERDLESIVEVADGAYGVVTDRLGEADDQVDIYLLDRVVGQGGYASTEWVAISYPDRKYSPVSLSLVMRHELTHRLDGAIGCDGAPALMREGLAVYLAGGHYHPESLREKASALLGTITYVPLAVLVDDFYTHQHEISYLEAGAIVSYLVDEYGWSMLERMCGAASDAAGDDAVRWGAALSVLEPAEAGDTSVITPVVGNESGLEVAPTRALERTWHAWLRSSGPQQQERVLLELEVELMDLMRTYQSIYDPAAHYLEGVLFSPVEAEDSGITADFVRRPRFAEAIAIELTLAMAQEAIEQRDAALLGILNAELDAALSEGVPTSELVSDILVITERAEAAGWEPYRMLLEGEGRFRLYVLNREAWPQQSVLVAKQRDGDWELAGTIWSD